MKVNTTLNLATITAVLATTITGCDTTEPEAHPIDVSALVAQDDPVFDLGEELIGPQGQSWMRVGYVEYSDAKIPKRIGIDADASIDTDALILSMSDEEAARFLRPRLEIGHHEYILSEEDALDFARTVRASLRNGEHFEGDPQPPEGGGLDIFRNVIAGFGDWSTINASATSSPHRYVATMDQGAGLCTAEKLVNHHTAVTAAHCLKDENGNWTARQRLRFQAGSANLAYGGTGNALGYLSSGCYGRVVPGCFDGTGGACDYAVLYLQGGGAWCNYADYNVGYFGHLTVNGEYNAMDARMSTYPGDPPGADTYPSLTYQARNDAETNGDDWVYYHNDTMGGSSGGPVYNWSNQMRAIHVGGLDNTWNVGMRITNTVWNFFTANAGS